MRRVAVLSAVVALALFGLPRTAQSAVPEVLISGQGVVAIPFGGDFSGEIIRISVTAAGRELDAQGQYPATGQIEIKTLVPFGGERDWRLHGSVVCIRDLSGFGPDAGGEGIWEVRFVANQSSKSNVPAGKHVSIYFVDTPAGDSVGWLDDPNAGNSPDCGPRGGISDTLNPLLDGNVRIRN
jgi:hypothetical protein